MKNQTGAYKLHLQNGEGDVIDMVGFSWKKWSVIISVFVGLGGLISLVGTASCVAAKTGVHLAIEESSQPDGRIYETAEDVAEEVIEEELLPQGAICKHIDSALATHRLEAREVYDEGTREMESRLATLDTRQESIKDDVEYIRDRLDSQ